MRLLFATDRLHIPDDFSGSVQSTHALIRGLLTHGHECNVVASLPRRWRHFAATALHRLSRNTILEWADRHNGYEVRRGSAWRFAERVERACQRRPPQVLILDSIRMLRALHAAGFQPMCPVVVVMHDTQFIQGSRDLPYGDSTRLVANSPYTASVVRQHFAVEPQMVPPVVHLNDYVTERPNAAYVTLISPHPRKGLDLVLDIAGKLPEVAFQLVEGWPMAKAEVKHLLARIQPLRNVRLVRSTADMRKIYRDTWVLLAPSELETFGRVVVEAQASAIPVMTSNAGALPWVVGSGGFVLPSRTDASEWIQRLHGLRENAKSYDELSAQAKANTLRADFQPEHVVAKFDSFLRSLDR